MNSPFEFYSSPPQRRYQQQFEESNNKKKDCTKTETENIHQTKGSEKSCPYHIVKIGGV